MTLPQNFNEWEHLQSQLLRVHNREVRDYFRDAADNDISTGRNSLKHACLLKDNDTVNITLLRLWLFEINCRHAQSIVQPVYGIPVGSHQQIRRFRPQIILYFQEDFLDIEPGYAPVQAEVSFRLMNESETTLTNAKVEQLAIKVRSTFATGSGFVWRKGKGMATYTEKDKGYQLRLFVRNKSEARQLISAILDIQSDTPQWKNMSYSENESPTEAYPTVPDRVNILGRSRRLPRNRPIANVRFQYALLHIHGLPHPIPLVDRSFTFREPVVALS